MNTRTEGISSEHASSQAREEFRKDVLEGLGNSPKHLPCKYFYDTRGSRLFEKLCQTPEYYLTRTELSLLREACPEVARQVGSRARVIEPGSGAGEKIRILLDALDSPRSFVPVDISKSALFASAHRLQKRYPQVEIFPVVADFTKTFTIPEMSQNSDEVSKMTEPSEGASSESEGRRLLFFPGSTISNFSREGAQDFLAELRRHLRPGDFLFIGVDRIKDRQTLESAYDDAQGVTAAFNLNLLERIARELDATVDPKNFRHRAFYNEDEGRIEMHLDSVAPQTVRICGQEIAFREGESIHTENSYKYSPEGFRKLAQRAGYELLQTFSDPAKLFSLYLCTVPG